MVIHVKGVSILLTPEQIKRVESELKNRELCRTGFVKMLEKFGFKRIDTSDWEDPKAICFEHVYYNWFADIQNHGSFETVFLVGEGLKDGSWPGWDYECPEDIENELSNAIDYLENSKV